MTAVPSSPDILDFLARNGFHLHSLRMQAVTG
jgi:hypothetical protein